MKIIIAMPVPKAPIIDIRAAAFCAALSKNPMFKWVWSLSHYPEMGRNAIIEFQLRDPEVSHIFFIDSDTVPPPDAVWRLFNMNKPIAAGITPMIIGGKEHAWNVKVDGKWLKRNEPLPNECFKASHVGGTTILIKREVLEKIGWPWYKTEFTQLQTDLRCIGRGEDVFFCDRAAECGYDIWINPEVISDHYNYINLLTMNENGITYTYEDSSISSYLDTLKKVITKSDGPVLELGCGDYSTNELHKLCEAQGKKLVSCENDKKWYDKFNHYNSPQHEVKFIDGWEQSNIDGEWGVVFVDSAPAESRAPMIRRYADKTQYMVVHDTEDPLYGFEDDLARFKYRFDCKICRPWTTVVSNKNSLEFLDTIKGE